MEPVVVHCDPNDDEDADDDNDDSSTSSEDTALASDVQPEDEAAAESHPKPAESQPEHKSQ
eukprot:1812283-Ditylum_brightwellii.AAC.1